MLIYLPSGRRELNVKALVGAFNQEKALVGAYSVIVKTDCETDGPAAAFLPSSLQLQAVSRCRHCRLIAASRGATVTCHCHASSALSRDHCGLCDVVRPGITSTSQEHDSELGLKTNLCEV